jgi:hypothetical protein
MTAACVAKTACKQQANGNPNHGSSERRQQQQQRKRTRDPTFRQLYAVQTLLPLPALLKNIYEYLALLDRQAAAHKASALKQKSHEL